MMTRQKNDDNEVIISISQARDYTKEGYFLDNDFFFYDHVKEENIPNNKRTLKCFLFVFCKKGMVRYECNNKTLYAKVNDIIILNSEQIVANHHLFYNFEGTALMISNHILPLLPYRQMSYLALKKNLEANPIIRLKQEDIDILKHTLQLIKGYSSKQNKFSKQSVFNIAQPLFNEFILNQDETIPPINIDKKTSDHFLAVNFARLVEENINKKINVNWCCQQLKYTSAKLLKVIQEYYHITPQKYIELKKIDFSFTLLLSTDLSIEEISHKLKFISASSYCRSFKRLTHTTPRHFRSLAIVQQRNIILHTIPYQTVV